MTAWRNVLVSGLFGASLLAGCTITATSGNSDGGLLDETGGTVGTGGAATIGGSATTGGSVNTAGSASTGGTTVAGSTVIVVQCTANYVAPATPRCGDNEPTTSCDSCLQTTNCSAAYKACYQTAAMDLISAMQTCMVQKFELSGTLPANAQEECLASSGMNGTGPDAANARALWAEIDTNLDCNEVCCAIITSH
jgi:hypothetical protein